MEGMAEVPKAWKEGGHVPPVPSPHHGVSMGSFVVLLVCVCVANK